MNCLCGPRSLRPRETHTLGCSYVPPALGVRSPSTSSRPDPVKILLLDTKALHQGHENSGICGMLTGARLGLPNTRHIP